MSTITWGEANLGVASRQGLGLTVQETRRVQQFHYADSQMMCLLVEYGLTNDVLVDRILESTRQRYVADCLL